MRLLSRTEIKRDTNQLIQAEKQTDVMYKLSREFNDFQRDIERKKQALSADFVAYAEDITNKRARLGIEVVELEQRKAIALASITDFYKEAEEKYETQKSLKDEAYLKEKNVSKREEILGEQRQEVAGREQLLNSRAESLSAREAQLMAEADALATRSKALEADRAEFTRNVEAKEQEISVAFEQIELSTKANTSLNQILLARRIEMDAEYAGQQKQIADQRATLDRAWQELRIKQSTN